MSPQDPIHLGLLENRLQLDDMINGTTDCRRNILYQEQGRITLEDSCDFRRSFTPDKLLQTQTNQGSTQTSIEQHC